MDGRCPRVPSLSHLDSNLAPGEVAPQLLVYTSPWIDICSPDPLISGVSEQVLKLEIAYAGFCGVENVVIDGPKLRHVSSRASADAMYARVIQEALSLVTHMHLSVAIPTVEYPIPDEDFEMGDLSELARQDHVEQYDTSSSAAAASNPDAAWDGSDAFGAWDSWNLIRSICNYSARLSVGKITDPLMLYLLRLMLDSRVSSQ